MIERKWYDKSIRTSLLGYGVMRLKTIDGKIDEEKGFELIDYAYKNGVNYFDTAMPYTEGQNEVFLGKALKKYDRDSLYIATKLSLGIVNSKEEMEQVIDKQLANLQTDYIDFYLLHALSKDRFEKLLSWDVFTCVERWRADGKIKYIGFSFHDEYESFKHIINYYDWDFCQLQLNYIDTNNQQGIKGYYDCVEKKIPVIVMEPVKGGKLASFNPKVANLFIDYNPSASLSSWALRWVGSLEGVMTILSGMNEMEQVIDNVNTLKDFVPLNKQELQLVEEVKNKLEKITAVGCTDCKYCMPCPVGVNIPKNFAMFNDYEMYQSKSGLHWVNHSINKDNGSSVNCVECNKCVKMCPQQINIPKELKRMRKELAFLYK